jgi:putative membrane protein insertion efficiency factor
MRGMLHRWWHEPDEKRKDKWYDNCDCTPDCTPIPDCDCIPCDFFSILLLGLGARAVPDRPPRGRVTVPGRAGMAAIRGYQRWLSPRLPTRCRHVPTCSEYGMVAVRRYGLVTGSRLTAARIRRCNPGTPRGTRDPVP